MGQRREADDGPLVTYQHVWKGCNPKLFLWETCWFYGAARVLARYIPRKNERANWFQLSTIYCRCLGSRSTAISNANEHKKCWSTRRSIFPTLIWSSTGKKTSSNSKSIWRRINYSNILTKDKHLHQRYFQIHLPWCPMPSSQPNICYSRNWKQAPPWPLQSTRECRHSIQILRISNTPRANLKEWRVAWALANAEANSTRSFRNVTTYLTLRMRST